MQEGLSVAIGADVTGLEKGLNRAQTSLKKFAQPVQGAAQSLQNISRIAQDAPFGFIAIQNNLEPLIQSFGSLRQQAGSTGGALKALFASLAGPAGLALGFSVVASAITSLIQKYGSLGNALKQLTGNLSDAQKFQEGYNKAVTEGIGNAAKEQAQIQALVAVAQDENIQRQGRQQAIDKLKQSYPGLLSDLSLETIGSENVAKAIAKINQQLILRARIQGVEKVISDQEAKRFEALNKPLEENLTFLDQVKGSFQLAFGNQVLGVLQLNQKAQQRLSESLGSISTQSGLAQTELQKLYKELALVEGITNKAAKAGAAIKAPNIVAAVDIRPSLESVQNFTKTADREINDQFARSVPVDVPILPTVPENVIQQFKQFGDLQKAIFDNANLKAKADEFKQILQQGLAVPLGDLIFNFLDKGKIGFKEFADTVIASIKRIVAQVAATKIIQLVGNALFPGAGTAGGFLAGIIGGGAAAPSLGGIGNGGISLNITGATRISGYDLVTVYDQTSRSVRRTG